jgi:anti-sigma factor RsiW
VDTKEGLTCQELVELITGFLEGALSQDDHERFEDHLGRCPWCVTYMEQFRITIDVLGTLTPDQLSPEARDQLMEAFRAWKR